jgi:uncharacterized protein YutD
MTIARQEKTRRVQMELSQNSFDRLNRLKDAIEASTYTEVMKDALRLYEYIVNSDSEGAKFFVKDKEGNSSEIKIFS